MVKKLIIILLLLLLPIVAVLSAASWVLMSRSGPLWLVDKFGDQGAVQIALDDFQGSLRDGFELQGLTVAWPDGRLSVDQLTLAWQPAELMQHRLLINSLQGGTLTLTLSGESSSPVGSQLPIPDFQPLFAALKDWTLELQSLHVSSLDITYADGSLTRLTGLAGVLDCRADKAVLENAQFAGDWGLWQGSLILSAEASRLTGQVVWQPPTPFGPLETFEAQLSVQPDTLGGVAGPVEILAKGEKPNYRLSGDIAVDLVGLKLSALKFDRGTESAGVARGELALGWRDDFSWEAELDLRDLDLRPEVDYATKISGAARIKGVGSEYAGQIDLRNEIAGWERLKLAGDFAGDAERIDLTQLQGQFLGGEVQGSLGFNWREGLASRFHLNAVNLHPARLPDGPEGEIDLLVDGWLNMSDTSPLKIGGLVQVSRGVLLAHDFQGELRGEWQGGRQLNIDNLELKGGWGELKAQGDLQQHLDLDMTLDDASALWSPLAGEGSISGWLGWSGAWPHGELKAQLHDLAYADWQLAEVSVAARKQSAEAEAEVRLSLTNLQKGENGLEDLDLTWSGLPRDHRSTLRISNDFGQAEVEFRGGLQNGRWQGVVEKLNLFAERIESFTLESPFALAYGEKELTVSEFRLQGDNGGRLRLGGGWNQQDGSASIGGDWQQFNLSWLNIWLSGMEFAGESAGRGDFTRNRRGEMAFSAQFSYVGDVGFADYLLQLDKAELSGAWGDQGLVVQAELRERGGGTLNLAAEAEAPAEISLPKKGDFHFELTNFSLAMLNRKLPAGTDLRGLLASEVSGHWSAGRQFSLVGKARVDQGVFSYQGSQSQLDLPLDQTAFDFTWQQEQFHARAHLGLGAGDELDGQLTLALPATWPLDLDKKVPLAGELRLQMGQLGALSLLVPERLADISGELGGVLRLAGSLQEPTFAGNLNLANGQLKLPQLGLELDNIAVGAIFTPELLKIETISLSSGEGRLSGKGELLFTGWTPEQLKVDLQGEKLLIVNLPELRVIASPDLQIVGNAQGLILGGTLKIPELQLINWHPVNRISRSGDVVYVDQLPKPVAPAPFKLILDLWVDLGDKVVIKDRGLDVKLKGKIKLNRAIQGDVFAKGQIDVTDGHYSTYGVKLPITSGRIFFNGGEVDNPALDIIAAKKVNEVTAGVAVGGTVRRPEIRLISDPAMDDTSILSYIVLGRPPSGSAGDFSALSLAAGALLSAGDSASFQQQLQTKSGIDVIDVRPGTEGTLETSVVTVGKYLTPELYLSYGRALSGTSNQLQLRYSPGKKIDFESQLGEVSGGDIYYRIEFE